MWVLCIVESFFDDEQDQSMCRVVRPLQTFETEHEAERVYQVFWPFYDALGEIIRVVEVDDLHKEFR